MAIQEYTKDGRTVRYEDLGDTIRIYGPGGDDDYKDLPKKMRPGEEPEGFDEYLNCLSGCYRWESKDPAQLAYCLWLCLYV